MKAKRKRREDPAAEIRRLRKHVAKLEARPAESSKSVPREGASESRLLATLMDSIPDNIYFKDTKSRFTLINHALCRLFKLKHPSEAIGKTDFDFFTSEHAAKALEDEQKVIRSGQPLAGKEEKETWPDGHETWVSTTKMPLRDHAGRVVGTFGISRNITERKRVEEELQRHRVHLKELVQERTASLTEANASLKREIAGRRRVEDELRQERDRARKYLDIAGTMIVVLDAKGRVALINRKGCEILGCREKEIVGKDWFSRCVPSGSVKPVKTAFGRLMAGKEEPDRHFDYEVRTRSGETRLIAWHNAVLRDESGAVIGALSSGEDITQRRRTEQILLQSERLDAVGTLADGVALSVNNIINVINDQAAFVASSTIPDTRPHEAATRILDATRRATELTKRLMGVAKAKTAGSKVDREVVRLDEIVRQVVELEAQPFAERKVRIVWRPPPRLSAVGIESDGLFDMVMVLLMNASDAMPDGGTLTLSAAVRVVPHPNPKLNPGARAGEFAVLSVRDTGVGISKENLPRIFDPFFTTKKPGESFGLGLSYVQSNIRRMGGWITVSSREGKGTTVRLFIPKLDLPESHDAAGERARLTRGRCVLVVDDQPELLGLMRDILRRAGYTVCAAKDAHTAMEMYRQHAGHVAVCVVDAVLPGSARNVLLKEITRVDAGTGVILTSGFSREYVRSFVPLGAWSFLQKPFDAAQFLEAVNEAVLRRAARERGAPVD